MFDKVFVSELDRARDTLKCILEKGKEVKVESC